jgi:hypothetical protein
MKIVRFFRDIGEFFSDVWDSIMDWLSDLKG